MKLILQKIRHVRPLVIVLLALIAIFVLSLMFELGRFGWAYGLVNKAAREAARYGVTGQPFDASGFPWTATDEQRVKAIINVARNTIDLSGNTTCNGTINYRSYEDCKNVPGAIGIGMKGQDTVGDGLVYVSDFASSPGFNLHVSVYYNLEPLNPIFRPFVPGGFLHLEANAELQNEGTDPNAIGYQGGITFQSDNCAPNCGEIESLEEAPGNNNSIRSGLDYHDIATISYALQPQRQVIIYTGEMVLVVKDTQEAIISIGELAQKMGGYVAASKVYQTSDNFSRGNITVRVLSENYEDTLAELHSLAVRVEQEESLSQDVTEEFIDLKARLANLKAGEEAMQTLLNKRVEVSKVDEILEVQKGLIELRAEIEQTEGRIRYLSDQASLSTINIQLIPEMLPPTPTPTPFPTPTPLPGWQPQRVVQQASQSLVYSTQSSINGLIWIIIFVIPLLIFYVTPVVIIIWLIRWGRKRYGKKGNASPSEGNK